MRFRGVRIGRRMAKETRLSIRIRSDLKKSLEAIAARERRSVAQICETFLEAGAEHYKKEGTKYIQRRFLAHTQE
jgi:hypothetical protein